MTFREEIIGDCRLILGDCREVLPMLESVNALVADPPYGIEGGKGGDATAFGKGDYGEHFEDTPEYIESVCAPIVAACLEKVEAAAVTPGIRCLHHYPVPRDIGCFWTPAAMTHGPWGMTTFQPILYYGRDWRAGRGAMPSGRLLTEAAPKVGHPCPKPVGAWSWLVDKACRPGGTVFDPFMGSGTTGICCARSDRKFIGCELSEEFFDIACRRIEEAYRQPRLFAEPVQKPVQESLI